MKRTSYLLMLSSVVVMTGCSNPLGHLVPPFFSSSNATSPKGRTIQHSTHNDVASAPQAAQARRVPETVQTPTQKPATSSARVVKNERTRPYRATIIDKESKFHQAMVAVAQSTKQDPNYHKLSLNTPEEKRWFKNLMYRLWDRQITRAQFINEGVARYPEHKYEFFYIANAFQRY